MAKCLISPGGTAPSLGSLRKVWDMAVHANRHAKELEPYDRAALYSLKALSISHVIEWAPELCALSDLRGIQLGIIGVLFEGSGGLHVPLEQLAGPARKWAEEQLEISGGRRMWHRLQCLAQQLRGATGVEQRAPLIRKIERRVRRLQEVPALPATVTLSREERVRVEYQRERLDIEPRLLDAEALRSLLGEGVATLFDPSGGARRRVEAQRERLHDLLTTAREHIEVERGRTEVRTPHWNRLAAELAALGRVRCWLQDRTDAWWTEHLGLEPEEVLVASEILSPVSAARALRWAQGEIALRNSVIPPPRILVPEEGAMAAASTDPPR